jgi:antitoxin component YwqK of YwqJK toxin-antitoxin module
MENLRYYIMILLILIFSSCNNGNKNISSIANLNIEYYENGKIKSIDIPEDSAKGKTATIWFNSNGNLRSIQHHIDTLNDGIVLWFYPNENLEDFAIFKNGIPNGSSFQFYRDGCIQAHAYWRDGRTSGLSFYYFDDTIGFVKSISRYNDTGKLVGFRRALHPNDDLVELPADKLDSLKPIPLDTSDSSLN